MKPTNQQPKITTTDKIYYSVPYPYVNGSEIKFNDIALAVESANRINGMVYLWDGKSMHLVYAADEDKILKYSLN